MSLKKYFDILGLPENASTHEIRKQFRALAMRYHPDKNTTPNAKEKFLQLTEAYEIVLGKKNAPIDLSARNRAKKEKSAEERIRDAKKKHFEQLYKEQQENERYFKSLFTGRKWRILKKISILGPILSALLLLDVFLQNHYETDKIISFDQILPSADALQQNSLVRTEKGNSFWISGIDYVPYSEFPTILIERSWLFHIPKKVVSVKSLSTTSYSVQFTFLSEIFVVCLFFCLPLFIRIYKKKTVLYTVLYHVSLYLSTALLIWFLLWEDHWAHVLVLGFL
jgi:hypothetical protein